MSDANLLVFGCVVTFIAFSGVYVYLRGDFSREPRESAEVESQPVKVPDR
jgi:hypothetical protein